MGPAWEPNHNGTAPKVGPKIGPGKIRLKMGAQLTNAGCTTADVVVFHVAPWPTQFNPPAMRLHEIFGVRHYHLREFLVNVCRGSHNRIFIIPWANNICLSGMLPSFFLPSSSELHPRNGHPH